MKNDIYYIKRCEALAEKAAANGDAPVGSVIVKGDEAIEAAKYKNDITCHAELEAIRLAVKKLKTNDLSCCVIYSTHEPCIIGVLYHYSDAKFSGQLLFPVYQRFLC